MHEQGWLQYSLCVCVSICLSVTALAGITSTRRAEIRYLHKALDVGNKNNRILAKNVSFVSYSNYDSL